MDIRFRTIILCRVCTVMDIESITIIYKSKYKVRPREDNTKIKNTLDQVLRFFQNIPS